MKVDLYREHRAEYVQPADPQIVPVPRASYLMIEGRGAPGGPEFQERIGGLYAMAYTTKMRLKGEGTDYRVMGLEGLYEIPEGAPEVWADPKTLEWRLIMRVPEFVSAGDLKASLKALTQRHRLTPAARSVRLRRWTEGTCVQMLHVGPYDAEGPDVARMAEFARAHGYELRGPHHEIYLSDPRRVPPARLRTLLRYGLRKTVHRVRRAGTRPATRRS